MYKQDLYIVYRLVNSNSKAQSSGLWCSKSELKSHSFIITIYPQGVQSHVNQPI